MMTIMTEEPGILMMTIMTEKPPMVTEERLGHHLVPKFELWEAREDEHGDGRHNPIGAS